MRWASGALVCLLIIEAAAAQSTGYQDIPIGHSWPRSIGINLGTAGTGASLKRSAGFAVDLPAYENDVLHAWQGLGYYNRARNLHATAKIVQDRHSGVLPRDLQKQLARVLYEIRYELRPELFASAEGLGKRLASAGGGEVKVWDAQTGQKLLALGRGTSTRWTVAFSPDGKLLAGAGGQSFNLRLGQSGRREVMMWDLQTGLELDAFRHKEDLPRFLGLAFSPDGRRLAGA